MVDVPKGRDMSFYDSVQLEPKRQRFGLGFEDLNEELRIHHRPGINVPQQDNGVCQLNGKSSTEHALSLIAIADPTCRDALTASACEINLI